MVKSFTPPALLTVFIESFSYTCFTFKWMIKICCHCPLRKGPRPVHRLPRPGHLDLCRFFSATCVTFRQCQLMVVNREGGGGGGGSLSELSVSRSLGLRFSHEAGKWRAESRLRGCVDLAPPPHSLPPPPTWVQK